MRVAVVGAGAIGTWLGAALSRAGHDVALLARGAHLEAMRTDGVRVEPADADPYTVRPLATDSAEEVGAVDVVLLCVKAHDQAAAGAAYAASLLGPETAVVAVQNGVPWWYFHPEQRRVEAVDPEGAVSAVWPVDRAIGCVVYLGAQVVSPGVVATRPENGLDLGEPDGSLSKRLASVAAALETAGFPVRRRPDIRTEIWTKLMGNATFNPVSVLTRSGLATMASDPGVAALVRTGMQEVVAVAAALDATPTISVDQRLAIAARLGDFKPSTLQDVEAGRRVELAALLGAVIELAGDVPVPTLRSLHALSSAQARALGLA